MSDPVIPEPASLTVVERERLEHASLSGGSRGWHAEIERIIGDRLAGERQTITEGKESAARAISRQARQLHAAEAELVALRLRIAALRDQWRIDGVPEPVRALYQVSALLHVGEGTP